MAGEATIGALRVVLGADTAKFEDNLNKAGKSLDTFGKRIATIGAGIGLERIIEGATRALVRFTIEAFESIDALGKQAQKVGVTVEEFSALNFAAQMADVSMETLSTGLGKLAKNMADTAAGTGEAQKTFQALGINVKNADGTMRSVNDVLGDVADKFVKTADGVNKTNTAIALFGKSGKEFIPLLNDGSSGLKEMADTAQRMGLIISKETAAAVQQFNDNMKLLNLTKQGFVNLVVAQLIPALVGLSNKFVEAAKSGDEIRTWAKRTGDALFEFIVIVNQVIAVNIVLGTALKELQTAFESVGTDFERVGEAFGNIKEIFNALPAILKAARTELEGYLRITVPGRAATEQLAGATDKFKDAMDSLALRTRVARQDFIGLADGLPELAARLKLTDAAGATLSTTVGGLSPKLQQLNQQMLLLKGAQLTQEFLTPWQTYEQTMIRLNALVAAGAISQETYRAAGLKAATDVATAYGNAAQAIVSPMAQAFKTMAEGNKKYAGIAKAAAIGEAIVNTYLAATKALASVPPPFNFAAAAAVTAAGLANVAKISQTEFAQGGSFKVGGVGGTDSQLIQMAMTPGEMVDVRKPGQERTVSEITVNMRGRDIFTGDAIRDLFEAINQGTSDGYRLKVAQ